MSQLTYEPGRYPNNQRPTGMSARRTLLGRCGYIATHRHFRALTQDLARSKQDLGRRLNNFAPIGAPLKDGDPILIEPLTVQPLTLFVHAGHQEYLGATRIVHAMATDRAPEPGYYILSVLSKMLDHLSHPLAFVNIL